MPQQPLKKVKEMIVIMIAMYFESCYLSFLNIFQEIKMFVTKKT